MLMVERPALDRRLLAALDAAPARIPVLIGGCGSGRSSALQRLRERIGLEASQFVDLERVTTTPERLYDCVTHSTPFVHQAGAVSSNGSGATPRDAFEATLLFFDSARTATGGPATFLLDEVLELRTFESFPGLRSVLRDFAGALARSTNRFVLTTRFASRLYRLLRDGSGRFEIVTAPPLAPAEVRAALPADLTLEPADADDLARAIHTLANGSPVYVHAMVDMMKELRRDGGADPLSALAALLGSDGRLSAICRFCYELRLHRARGYGALKAILHVLAEEEPLTLTEISQRLHRTPGSTKDYLSWLEDVDLITVRQKRYSYADPLLRLWVRIHGRAEPPTSDDVAREVHRYALQRLPVQEPAMAAASTGRASTSSADADDDKGWGIIEFD